jgi:hypothetical protein
VFKPKTITLAQTQEAFDAQVDEFLVSEGFEVNQENRAMFAAAIQHSDSNEDSFNPKAIGKMMRKAVATRLAFYVIHPSKRPQPVAPSEPEATSESHSKVESQA